ncbi:hypothetical protein RND81_14G113400 [Saponaria officinalis]|uniref:RNase H type-1 domain-containing protein n=1 Tax=Saponaria officinalis TaxID=3572 RepID=A0AAW1GSS2_SAPOF
MMKKLMEASSIHGIRITPQAPSVTHLLFVDDSISFTKAKIGEARQVQKVLRDYESASGQMINLEKTTISFSNGTRGTTRQAIVELLGVTEVQVQDKYLGLPTVVSYSKRAITETIRDKISKKLQGWRGMLPSKAGREVLIKVVARSIPTYAMSVFKIPGNFCSELRSLVSHFWWGAAGGQRKFSWIARIQGHDDSCPICHAAAETDIHLLRDCGWVGWVWGGLGLEVDRELDRNSVREWVEREWKEWGEEEHIVFLTGCWAIWEARNKWVFEGRQMRPEVVSRRVNDLIREMQETGVENEAINVDSLNSTGWTRPNEGWLKEAKLREARPVIVEGDNLRVMEDLKKKKTVGRSNLHLIHDEILVLCNSFDSVDFSFVRRSSNF